MTFPQHLLGNQDVPDFRDEKKSRLAAAWGAGGSQFAGVNDPVHFLHCLNLERVQFYDCFDAGFWCIFIVHNVHHCGGEHIL
jgi:hypothetical protein